MSSTVGGRSPSTAFDLVPDPLPGRGVGGQQRPGPAQGGGRRLVAGHEECEGLAPELVVGHRLPGLLVAGPDQHREQVAVVAALAPALADEVQHELVQRPDRPLEPEVGRRRHPGRGRGERLIEPAFQVTRGDAERRPDGVRLVAHVAAEERPAGDGERQPRHLGRDIDGFPRRGGLTPSVQELGRGVDHDLGITGHSLAMEGRLRQPSLPPPGIPLGDDQVVPEQIAEEAILPAAQIVLRVVVEDAPDVVGVVHEVDQERSDPEAKDVPEPLTRPEQEIERIAQEPAELAGGQRKPLRDAGSTRHLRRPFDRVRQAASAGSNPWSLSI